VSKYLAFPDIVFKDRALLIGALADLGYTNLEEGHDLPLFPVQRPLGQHRLKNARQKERLPQRSITLMEEQVGMVGAVGRQHLVESERQDGLGLADVLESSGAAGLQIRQPSVQRLTKRYTAAILPIIGPEQDIPAPDVNTDEQTMAWIVDTVTMMTGKHSPEVVTGKPIELGGSRGRTEATGRDLVAGGAGADTITAGSGQVSIRWGLRGPTSAIATACATGASLDAAVAGLQNWVVMPARNLAA